MKEDLTWALRIAAAYDVKSQITYVRSADVELKLDVYQPSGRGAPRPTLMFFHAGGWAEDATKETWSLWFLPFLQLGWVIVNVDYRPATVSLAPGAVEDCLHALRWASANAAEYNIDTQQLVLAGLSAGGHLALTTGMLPRSCDMHELTGASEQAGVCPTLQSFRVWTDTICPIAIVSWCGITDVAELVEGPHVQDFAVAWVGERADRRAVAEAVSPIRYVRAGLPSIVTVHGDADTNVPYGQAVRFHQLLSLSGVRNELITAQGAGHNLSAKALEESYPRVFDFLRMSGVSGTACQGEAVLRSCAATGELDDYASR